MKIIKINGEDIECEFVKIYESTTTLKFPTSNLLKYYNYDKLKVVVAKEIEVNKLIKLIQENNAFSVKYEKISDEFYICQPNYEDITNYIKAGFLDLDFVPIHPNLREIKLC